MSFIKILDDSTINKIAAGEVIERPSSIVKELIENSIDAGATAITIEVYGGGIKSIRIIDNGKGIDEEDLENAFLRHATSKIDDEIDLNTITTLGFRGEALASIAAVSNVEMMSSQMDSTIGNRVCITGGKVTVKESCGCPQGTIINVKDVFFNTPARLKFLKSESREGIYITSIVENLAMSHTNISFNYKLNDKTILVTRGDGDLKSVLLSVYGKAVISNIILVDLIRDFVTVRGYIGNSNISKNSRNNQSIYINSRFVRNKTITAAVEAAYKSMLTINKFPFFVINVSVNPEFIDVNVHPTKAEVKFQDEQIIFKAVYHAVKEALISISDLKEDSESEPKHSFVSNIPKLNYSIEKLDLFNNIDNNNITNKLEETIHEGTKISENANYAPQVHNNNNYSNLDLRYSPSKAIETIDDSGGKIPKFEPLAIVGQIHFLYIVAEGMEEMYLIDQHAAHERVYYEKYLNEYNKSSIQSQNALVPLIIELSLSEKQGVLQNINLFTKLGYEIEDFGGNSIALRSIPVIYGSPDPIELFNEIIQGIHLDPNDIMHTIDKVFYTMACKSAIKAGDKLNLKEMSELVEQLRRCDNPYNCPHGRPTIIKMPYYELEKKFKRVQ